MISPSDAEFHPRDPADRTWTETTVLMFYVPEAGLLGNAYVLARPNVGIAHSAIVVGQGLCPQPYQIDLNDPQMHLPCPDSFAKYSLANGLTVDAFDGPKGYHMTYENGLGKASFDLTFRASHEPFDPHDQDMNPLLTKTSEQPADSRLGDEWSTGHFEAKGHVTGRLELRGKEYEVDCWAGMDHSWGPRTELGTRSVSWFDINFGEDLAFHMAIPMHLERGVVTYDDLRFGFVVERGQVHGLVQANVMSERVDLLPVNNHVRLTDVRGKEWEFFGTAISGHPWYSFNPCHTCFQSLMRYHHDGRLGYGEQGDIFGLDYLSEHMSRHGRER